MTPHRPPLRTIALFVTRSVVASAFFCVVAGTAACGADSASEDDETVTPTAPTSVYLSFAENEVSVVSSPKFTGPDGVVKPVTWKLRLSGGHFFEPAAGEPQIRLSLSATLDGDLETYFLYTVFDVTSVPTSLSPSHATSAYNLGTPPPGGSVTSFSGTVFSTTGPATDFESTGATGTTSLESYAVSGTTNADARITASMKFDELALQTDGGDFVVDGTLSFSGAKEGGRNPVEVPVTECEKPANLDAMCESRCPSTEQSCVLNFDSDCAASYECVDQVSDLLCNRYKIIEPGSTLDCSYGCDGSGRIRDTIERNIWTARPVTVFIIDTTSEYSEVEKACTDLGMRLPTLPEYQSVFSPYCESAFPMPAYHAFTSTHDPAEPKGGLYGYSCYIAATGKTTPCLNRVAAHCLRSDP